MKIVFIFIIFFVFVFFSKPTNTWTQKIYIYKINMYLKYNLYVHLYYLFYNNVCWYCCCSCCCFCWYYSIYCYIFYKFSYKIVVDLLLSLLLLLLFFFYYCYCFVDRTDVYYCQFLFHVGLLLFQTLSSLLQS